MVISAAHFKDVTNGYEKRTDGLWTHTGKLVVKQGPVELPSGSIGASAVQVPPLVWADLSLTSPWAAWDPAQSAWDRPSYCKDWLGFVHLRGLLGSNGAAVSSIAATLPVGFRPLRYHLFGTPIGTTNIGQWYVQPNGQLSLQGVVPAVAAPNTYYALSGITFPGEQ